MLDYEIFKEVVQEKIKDYLPPQYGDAEVIVQATNKVNRTLDGMIISLPGNNVSPTIYLNDMYAEYKKSNNLEEILTNAAMRYAKAFEETPVINVNFEYEDIKDKVVFQLINTEQNKRALAELPHREFQDLSVVYRIALKYDEDGLQSAMINNQMMERLGVTEEQLYALAEENTKVIFPPRIRTMNDIMKEMFERDGMPQEMLDELLEDMTPERTMWIINNQQGINGASSMLYEDLLYDLAETLDKNLYILPSSIHEVIAVSTEMGEPNELSEMVNEINMSHVNLEERLSNQVYYYDKDKRTISIASNNPNKRLDGKEAEPMQMNTLKAQAR